MLKNQCKNRNGEKQVIPESRPKEFIRIRVIWTFDTELPAIFDKTFTYITFKSADNLVTVTLRDKPDQLAEVTTEDTHLCI